MTEIRGIRFQQEVGRELRAQAAREGLSVAAMARLASIDRSQVDNYLKGNTRMPIGALLKLCEAVSVKPSTLVDRAYTAFLDAEKAGGTSAAAAPGLGLVAKTDPDAARERDHGHSR